MDGCLNVAQITCLDGLREVSFSPHYSLFIVSLTYDKGSSGDNIVSHFAVYYHNEAASLGIDLNDLYSALLADGDLNPPEWNTEGRQVNVYK